MLASVRAIDEPPEFTRLVAPVLAVGSANAMLAWLVNIELSGEAQSIEGTLIYDF